MPKKRYIKLTLATKLVNYSYPYLHTLYVRKVIAGRVKNGHIEIDRKALLAYCNSKHLGKFKMLINWLNEDSYRVNQPTREIQQEFKERGISLSYRTINRAKQSNPDYVPLKDKRKLIYSWFETHPTARYMKPSNIQRKLELEGLYISCGTIKTYKDDYYVF